MKKLLTTVVCGLAGINAMLGADPSRPKLVVGIMVDQLRTDYVESLQNLFGENGFRRLMKDGVFIRNVDFKVNNLDRANSTAMVYTGAYPRQNGVAGAMVYNPERKEMLPVLYDSAIIGNFTDETYSPSPLRLSTLSDEIAIDGVGVSAVYSVAPDAQQSIIMAGHAGNSAYWLNENTGKWATTTYYRESPRTVSERNYSSSVASRIDTMQWKPALPVDQYPGLPAQKRMFDFKHRFALADRDVYRTFASTPLVNKEITDIALDYIREMNVGNRGDAIDMLNLGYTAAPFKDVKDGDFRAELIDSYVRLDGQLGILFDEIDKKVGLNNTLLFLVSTGYYDDSVVDDPKYRIPTGTFSVKRALSLLGSYLTAKYGNGSYVDTYSKGHVYLDRKEIEKMKLDLDVVAAESRDFLVQMSGVADAYTMNDIMSSGLKVMESMRLGNDPKTGGDVILEFNPGWKVVDDTRFPNSTQVVRANMVATPAFIMAPSLQPDVINATVDATTLAPTVAQILRIRSPNGAVSQPVMLRRK